MNYKKLAAMGMTMLLLLSLASCRSQKPLQEETDRSVQSQITETQERPAASREDVDSAQDATGPDITAPEAEQPLKRPEQAENESLAEHETGPSEDSTEPSEKVDYLRYHSMTGEEQKAFVESFSSFDDFFKWHEQAQKEYEANKNDIVVDDDSVIELGG